MSAPSLRVIVLAAVLAAAATFADFAHRADGSAVNRDRKGDSLRSPAAVTRCEVA